MRIDDLPPLSAPGIADAFEPQPHVGSCPLEFALFVTRAHPLFGDCNFPAFDPRRAAHGKTGHGAHTPHFACPAVPFRG